MVTSQGQPTAGHGSTPQRPNALNFAHRTVVAKCRRRTTILQHSDQLRNMMFRN